MSIDVYLWPYTRKYFVPVVQWLKIDITEFIDIVCML